MINGLTTTVQRDGWLFYDRDRPYSCPAIFATEDQLNRFIATAGNWPDRITRYVAVGDVIPLHHHRTAYWGYAVISYRS